MNPRCIVSVAALALGLGAMSCAHHSGEPVRVRAGEARDLRGVDMREHPVIIEFREGDILPFDVNVEGDILASPKDASIPLVAKRPFFLRIDGDEIKVSRDGSFKDTARTRGSMAFGLGVSSTGTRAGLTIRTPVH